MTSIRRLPHDYPDDRWLFLTWHLHAAFRSAQFPPPRKASAGQAFIWLDRQLDLARVGPRFLQQDEIASIVVQSLYRGVELGHYELGAFVVMPNHVHVLLLPKVSPTRLMKALKGSTAREANRHLGRSGEPVWQKESYDHWVRNQQEWVRIARYIENNPVKAGSVLQPEDFRWSSARLGVTPPGIDTSVDAARTSACATSGTSSNSTSNVSTGNRMNKAAP